MFYATHVDHCGGDSVCANVFKCYGNSFQVRQKQVLEQERFRQQQALEEQRYRQQMQQQEEFRRQRKVEQERQQELLRQQREIERRKREIEMMAAKVKYLVVLHLILKPT